jgi:chaperonin GroES
MKIRPINSQVLVKPLEAGEKTAGGIYVPDSGKEKPKEGKVIAVAKDATEEIAVGDRVIYKEFSGTEVSTGGEDYILIPSEDLLVKYVAADEIPE